MSRSRSTKKIGKATSGRKAFKRSVCSPTRRLNRYTCYTDQNLHNMKEYWNARHPDVPIKATSPKEIWHGLKQHMSSMCNTERCWLRQKFMQNKLNTELTSYTFAPTAPTIWKKNPVEWLTSVDIDKVMKQWEHKYKNFEFIGPSPIDFDTRVMKHECVWSELCNFNLKKSISREKRKIGIIFNLDPHYKEGSHWIALYIDVKKKLIFFFDSNGDKPPRQVNDLIKRITEQGKELNIEFQVLENHPIEHQKGDTECGIYTIYVITQLLSGKKSPKYFMSTRVPDKKMFSLRKEYFNYN